MSNPTTPFGWQMPEATDLVTDLPADFEVFGQAVATDLQYLLGGTTGQVLAKASGTDLDFDWVTDASGMTNPMTTTSDMIYSSSGSTPDRIGIGSNGDVLTVTAGVPGWAAPSTSFPASTDATVNTEESTTSTSYTGLTTPLSVTLTTGTKALVIVTCQQECRLGGQLKFSMMSYAVSGATTIAANDEVALQLKQIGASDELENRASAASLVTLTAGSNTFTTEYRVTGNTGFFAQRNIIVINLA
jgi:hypothetical protein